jgi:hypothetical protein
VLPNKTKVISKPDAIGVFGSSCIPLEPQGSQAFLKRCFFAERTMFVNFHQGFRLVRKASVIHKIQSDCLFSLIYLPSRKISFLAQVPGKELKRLMPQIIWPSSFQPEKQTGPSNKVGRSAWLY